MKHVFVCAAVSLGLVAIATGAEVGGGGGVLKKNVLVIVLDDLGTDKLSFYEDWTCIDGDCRCIDPCRPTCAVQDDCIPAYPRTPRLDALRKQGVWFTNAYSMPVCSPTRACIQTGRYPLHTGMGEIVDHGRETCTSFEVSNDEKFLAELVRQGFSTPYPAGNLPYKCGAFGKWHLSYMVAPASPCPPNPLILHKSHAVENGYHVFKGSMGNVDPFQWTKIESSIDPLTGQPIVNEVMYNIDPPFDFTTATWQASVTRQDALAWMTAQNKAFLAYVCFNPPHEPWTIPPIELLSDETQAALLCSNLLTPGGSAGECTVTEPDLLDDRLRLVHSANIEAVDKEVGLLIDGLSAAVRNNTMIFIIGDNGTPNQVLDKPPFLPQHSKGSLYQGGIRVPLIVTGPLVKSAGRPATGWKSEALVSVVDFWKTIADVTGANVPQVAPISPLNSVSFLSVLQHPDLPDDPNRRPFVFSQTFEPNGAWPWPPPDPVPGVPATSCFARNRRMVTDGVYKYRKQEGSLTAGTCQLHPPGPPLACPHESCFNEILTTLGDEETNLLDDPHFLDDPANVQLLESLRAAMIEVSGD